MPAADHAPDFLLSLDGFEFRLTSGYVIKIQARRVTATRHRPHGVKYRLTLHDPLGRRIYGMDNVHGVRRQAEYDHHRRVDGQRTMVAYAYRGPSELLTDFYREVERIVAERGVG